MLIGSSDGNGNADVTPKGDKPGFVAVLDDTTLAIPDRPGNNRLDTLENVVANPSVGLLFLIPGMNETLRVNGEAQHHRRSGLRERLQAEGKLPTTVMVVSVKAAYMHCAKAFMRSELWQPESWPDRSKLPTLGQILKDQLALADSAEATDRWLDEAYRSRCGEPSSGLSCRFFRPLACQFVHSLLTSYACGALLRLQHHLLRCSRTVPIYDRVQGGSTRPSANDAHQAQGQCP